MKQIITTIIFSFFAFVHAGAQGRLAVSIGTGIGQYKMEDMKELQESQGALFGLPMKAVDNFPMRPYITSDVSYKVTRRLTLFLSYQWQTTGAKSAYSDYSGVVRIEQILGCHNVGLGIGVDIARWNKLALSTNLKGYYGFTEVRVKGKYEIYDYPQFSSQNTSSFDIRSIMINPDVKLSYSVYNNWAVNLSAGYMIDLREDKDDDNSYPLRNQNNEALTPDWSGIRIGLGVSYSFGKAFDD